VLLILLSSCEELGAELGAEMRFLVFLSILGRMLGLLLIFSALLIRLSSCDESSAELGAEMSLLIVVVGVLAKWVTDD
jgi:hypothetical protein